MSISTKKEELEEGELDFPIEIKPDDKFLVTGYYYNSTRKFRMVVQSWAYANSINLWRGHIWLLRKGHRKLLKSVYN